MVTVGQVDLDSDEAGGEFTLFKGKKVCKERQQTIKSMNKKRTFTQSLLKSGQNSLEDLGFENPSDSEEEDDDEDIQKDAFNTHCGLRTISEKVLQVLIEKR